MALIKAATLFLVATFLIFREASAGYYEGREPVAVRQMPRGQPRFMRSVVGRTTAEAKTSSAFHQDFDAKSSDPEKAALLANGKKVRYFDEDGPEMGLYRTTTGTFSKPDASLSLHERISAIAKQYAEQQEKQLKEKTELMSGLYYLKDAVADYDANALTEDQIEDIVGQGGDFGEKLSGVRQEVNEKANEAVNRARGLVNENLNGAINSAKDLANGKLNDLEVPKVSVGNKIISPIIKVKEFAMNCVREPIILLKYIFPSLDEEVLRRVISFFKVFSVKNIFTQEVVRVLKHAIKGNFTPLLEGLTKVLFGFRFQLDRLKKAAGIIGHKLSFLNPFRNVHMRYMLDTAAYKLKLVLPGKGEMELDLNDYMTSVLNKVCIPLFGMEGIKGCLHISTRDIWHNTKRMICLSTSMRYIFFDGPKVVLGCRPMETKKPSLLARMTGKSYDTEPNQTPLEDEEKDLYDEFEPDDDDEAEEEADYYLKTPQPGDKDSSDSEEQESLLSEEEEEEEEEPEGKTMLSHPTFELVKSLEELKGRVRYSDKALIERVQSALRKVLAFVDARGKLSVTWEFMSKIFLPRKVPPGTTAENMFASEPPQ